VTLRYSLAHTQQNFALPKLPIKNQWPWAFLTSFDSRLSGLFNAFAALLLFGAKDDKNNNDQ